MPDTPSSASRRAFRESLGWSPDVPLVVHVGRFHVQKNHLGVIAVFKEVLEREPSARLLLIGDGPLRPQIEEAIAVYQLSANVRLLGTQDRVPTLLAMCDVFLFPSFHEGLPVAAMEASASGLPIVGTDIPGLNEVVVHEKTGMLHDPTDVEGMAQSVVALIRREAHFGGMGDAARRHAASTFTADAAAGRLVRLYDECLSNR